jgi:hypothetical protein
VKSGCLICGKELVYAGEASVKQCMFCGATMESEVACPDDHFVCDACHGLGAFDWIERHCSSSQDTDPYRLALILMDHPSVKMHGPEHHFLVPAVLLTTYFNLKGEKEKIPKSLSQARQRAEKVPGGFCGFCGNCGAAVGTGIFFSVVTGATPLSEDSWALANRMTAKSLLVLAEHGGPRCCKRDTFLSIREAIKAAEEHLDVSYGTLEEPRCKYSTFNKQCKLEDCFYYSTVPDESC